MVGFRPTRSKRWRGFIPALAPLAWHLLSAFGCQALHPDPQAVAIPSPPAPACLEVRRTAIAIETPKLSPATGVIPPPIGERTIDLTAVLERAGLENPSIALAQEAVRASLAERLQARALLLPTLDAGMSLNEHWGNLQSAEGLLREVDRQSLYVGAGAGAVGAGTVSVPGVHLTAQLADAVFAPVSAEQHVIGSRFSAAATRNAVLLDVVERYFDLIGAEARTEALRQSRSEIDEIVRIASNFAAKGQGREGDADRARSEAHLLRTEEARAQEEAAVASAELARLLDTDPAVRLRGPGGPVPLIQIVDPSIGVKALLEIALANHPQIAARTADVAAAEIRLRQERIQPFLPIVSVGFSAGQFGGGSNLADRRFDHFDGRGDFDVLAVWSLENLGFGNLALQQQRRAIMDELSAVRLQTINRVRLAVAEAHADTVAGDRAAKIVQHELEIASASFRRDLMSMRNQPTLTLEILVSFRQLVAARRNLVSAAIDYDKAQFRLYAALGQPPCDVLMDP